MSATARIVATGVLLESPANDPSAPLARACLELDPRGRGLLRLLGSRAGRAALRAMQWLTIPRIAAHYAWRKRRVARWAYAAVDAGARQAIVLGAGWDALGLKLARHPAKPFVIELDAPATLAIKRRAIEPLENLALVEADLGAELRLRDVGGFDATAPTLVVAEGVLMYLEPARVVALANELRAAIDARLHVIATAMTNDAHWHPRFVRERPPARWWLRLRGAPFRWGVERFDLARVLADAGFELLELARADEPADPDPAPGEWLFAAEARR